MPIYLFDLWMTLVFSLSVDPILTVQELLGYGVRRGETTRLDDHFLTACLTTNIADERSFLRQIGRQFGLRLTKRHHRQFRELLESERRGVTLYPETVAVLTALKSRGARMGVVSNLWPFPVQHIFEGHGLGAFFEHRVYSFEVGSRKPDRRIFEHALRRFGVRRGDCVMVGDSLGSDIAGALSVGMKAVFVNRSGKVHALPDRVREIKALSELL